MRPPERMKPLTLLGVCCTAAVIAMSEILLWIGHSPWYYHLGNGAMIVILILFILNNMPPRRRRRS